MKKVMFFGGIVCIAAIISSCGSSKKVVNSVSLNGEWNIVELDGKTIATTTQQPKPYIGFDFAEKRIYGNSGCNRMMGSFDTDSLKSKFITFGPIATTRMACPDMTTEQSILGALNKVKSYEVVNCDEDKEDAVCKLALCDARGNKLVVIEKKEVKENPESTLADLNGEWLIEKINGEAVGKSEKIPFIGINVSEKRIYGSAGCNSINGMLKQEENIANSINFSQMATTMMMCADMEVEKNVLNALNAVKSFKLQADEKLALMNAEGVQIITLKKK